MADTLTLLNAATMASRDARVGRGFVTQVAITANVTFGATETVIMSTPSMTFTNGRAYMFTVWGLHSAAADNYAYYKIRKGTTNAGTIYKDQMRVNNLQASSSNGVVFLQSVLTNVTGADITTQISLTGIQGGVAQTWTFAASATNVAYLLVEDCGSTANYTGQPIS